MLKILHVVCLLFFCGSTLADNNAYRCEVDGKIIIQDSPCKSKQPEIKKVEKPDYGKVVNCAFLYSAKSTFELMFFNKKPTGDKCTP